MSIPLPTNEEERLAALGTLGILDTKPETTFDRITELAQTIFDVSTASVSMVDRDRQWFKSVCGWNVKETPREISFCTYAILDDRVLVVEDTAEDERFASNPQIDAEESIRFYAGAPLVLEDDIRVGTLCLTDDEPCSFSSEERQMLASLADVVVELLEARRQTYQIGYLTSALEEAEDAVVVTEANPIDPPGPRIVWANEAFSRMTGYEREEIVGETPRILQGPETSRSVLNKVRSALENERAVYAETVNYRKDDTPYVVAWHIAPVHNEENELTHWVSIQRNVTDQQEREEHLKHKAMHDSLTGLPNRYAIQKNIQKVLDESTEMSTGALLYIDLDKFKPINDKFGHKVGDEVLIRTAKVLREAVRDQDTVGRLGGDEFVVYLPEIETVSEARIIAERLHDALCQPFQVGSYEISVSASIGGTVRFAAHDTVEDALHEADMAMYEAKESSECSLVLRGPFSDEEQVMTSLLRA